MKKKENMLTPEVYEVFTAKYTSAAYEQKVINHVYTLVFCLTREANNTASNN